MKGVRLCLVVLSLATAALCLKLFAEERQGETAAVAAASLRQEPEKWRKEAGTLQRYLAAEAEPQSCQGQRDRDLLTLALAWVDLDVGTTPRHEAGTRSALQQANARARHLLSCSPTDGQAWLDLAILGARLAGKPEAAYPGMILSARFAPHEAATVKARIRYGIWLSGQSVAAVDPLLAADLGVFVNGGSLADLKTLFATVGPKLLPFLQKVTVSSYEPARLALMKQARGF